MHALLIQFVSATRTNGRHSENFPKQLPDTNIPSLLIKPDGHVVFMKISAHGYSAATRALPVEIPEAHFTNEEVPSSKYLTQKVEKQRKLNSVNNDIKRTRTGIRHMKDNDMRITADNMANGSALPEFKSQSSSRETIKSEEGIRKNIPRLMITKPDIHTDDQVHNDGSDVKHDTEASDESTPLLTVSYLK